MNDHCKCCGVKFDGEVIDEKTSFITETENYRWLKHGSHPCSGHICFWCACYIPGNIARIAIGDDSCTLGGVDYTYDNFKTFPNLRDRIAHLGLTAIKENKEDDSRWNCKCKICGAPAYQGLMNIECSKGCK